MSGRVFVDAPVLCGHRGSGAGVVRGHRENTLDSFLAAAAAGLTWVEVDARRTADDVLVVNHDPVVRDGRFVSEMTVADADAAGLMRLARLFEELPAGVGVNVDVKTSLEDALRPREATTGALVADLVASQRRPLLVTSFDPAAVLIVRERAAGVPVGLLTWGRFPLRKAIAAAAQLGLDVVAPHVTAFPFAGDVRERAPSESVRVAHAAGLEVVGWGAQPGEIESLIAAGVDCVIVDDAPGEMTRRSHRGVRRRRRHWPRRAR